MSNPVPETPREVRDRHIFELTGIQPDPRSGIPQEEVKGLVRGVKIGVSQSMEGLLAARLGWVYDKYVQNDAIKERSDLADVDILQMGSVAILETAREVDVDSPNFNQLFITKARRIMVGQIMEAKLLPAIGKTGHKLVDARYEGQEDRMLESIVPADDFGGVAVAKYATVVNQGNPEKAVLAMEAPGVLKSAMGVLDGTDRNVIGARYGLGVFSALASPSFTEIGDMLGMNRETVRRVHEAALEKLQQTYEELTAVSLQPHWTEKRLALQREWIEEVKSKPAVGEAAFVTGSLLERQQQILQRKWFAEIRRKQEAGKLAFVTGSLLERPLPGPVSLYLLMEYEGEDDLPSTELQAAIREAGVEEFRAHRLTSVAA